MCLARLTFHWGCSSIQFSQRGKHHYWEDRTGEELFYLSPGNKDSKRVIFILPKAEEAGKFYWTMVVHDYWHEFYE